MAINKNHPFEEINGIRCAVVETGASAERVAFLKAVLQHNGFEVVVAPVVPKPAPASETADLPQTEAPQSFTVGVTNLMFNVTNALFGRQLKTPDGRVVTLAYWHQKEPVSHEETPYFETGRLFR